MFYYLSILLKRFESLNRYLLEQIIITWKKNQLVFVICDDYLIPRFRKKGYRVGKFRDPIHKRIRLGHNVVNTIITNSKIDLGVKFELQPKYAKIIQQIMIPMSRLMLQYSTLDLDMKIKF